MSDLICSMCGNEIPRHVIGGWCRVCLHDFCSESCASRHEHEKHMPHKAKPDEKQIEAINETVEPEKFDWSRAFDLNYMTEYYRRNQGR